MKVAPEVQDVLNRSTTSGHILAMPPALERSLYQKVAKVVELAGGKWNRKAQAHLFEGDAAAALDPIMMTGEVGNVKKELDQFFTPDELALKVAALAEVKGKRVLEPSAGAGALAKAAMDLGAESVDCVETDFGLARSLTMNGFNVLPGNFLTFNVGRYDVVLMNPPFSKMQDAKHVLHACGFVGKGGRVVAIMSSAVKFRDAAPYRELRAIIEAKGGKILDLPEGSFKASGTMVNTVVVVIDL